MTAPQPLAIIVATALECQALIAAWRLAPGDAPGRWQGAPNAWPIHLIVSGIGPVNAAFALGSYLATHQPVGLLQIGIAGAYPGSGLALLDVVQVVQESYADLGATQPDCSLLDMAAMGFALGQLPDGTPLYNRLTQPSPLSLPVPNVSGLTSATVSGHAALIAAREARWQPHVETMEGAVLFQAALQSGVPFAQLRCISNAVAPRNPATWRIQEAAAQMQTWVIAHMEAIINAFGSR
jgi:futalosine hydrolase